MYVYTHTRVTRHVINRYDNETWIFASLFLVHQQHKYPSSFIAKEELFTIFLHRISPFLGFFFFLHQSLLNQNLSTKVYLSPFIFLSLFVLRFLRKRKQERKFFSLEFSRQFVFSFSRIYLHKDLVSVHFFCLN